MHTLWSGGHDRSGWVTYPSPHTATTFLCGENTWGLPSQPVSSVQNCVLTGSPRAALRFLLWHWTVTETMATDVESKLILTICIRSTYIYTYTHTHTYTHILLGKESSPRILELYPQDGWCSLSSEDVHFIENNFCSTGGQIKSTSNVCSDLIQNTYTMLYSSILFYINNWCGNSTIPNSGGSTKLQMCKCSGPSSFTSGRVPERCAPTVGTRVLCPSRREDAQGSGATYRRTGCAATGKGGSCPSQKGSLGCVIKTCAVSWAVSIEQWGQ